MSAFQKTNHLASQLERLNNARLALPTNLLAQYKERQALTAVVQQHLTNQLTPEILAQCQVVDFDATSLTLTVPSQTVANHLLYLQHQIVAQLIGQHSQLMHLTHLKVIVV